MFGKLSIFVVYAVENTSEKQRRNNKVVKAVINFEKRYANLHGFPNKLINFRTVTLSNFKYIGNVKNGPWSLFRCVSACQTSLTIFLAHGHSDNSQTSSVSLRLGIKLLVGLYHPYIYLQFKFVLPMPNCSVVGLLVSTKPKVGSINRVFRVHYLAIFSRHLYAQIPCKLDNRISCISTFLHYR